jgi:RNA polymerase sigma-70 factor (ECF subfamily)
MQLAGASLPAAMAEIVRRYQDRVRSYCCKWDPQRGEDTAQEAFATLWRGRHDYRPRNQFRLYLFTIVRNCCRNARRWWFRHKAPELPVTERVGATEEGTPLDDLLARERIRRVQGELACVSPKLREAVLLRYCEELSYAEIASILEVPEVTARSRVFLGLRELRKRLQEQVE